jgi:hypothetical protein
MRLLSLSNWQGCIAILTKLQMRLLTTGGSLIFPEPCVCRRSPFAHPPSDDTNFAVKPVAEWARSAMYVAQYYYVLDGGDLELARDLLEKVGGSNSEEADSAADLLKKVKGGIRRRGGGDGDKDGVKEESSVEM